MSNLEDAGIYLRYKLDRKLFRQYTRNAEEIKVNECQFADDAALLATTKRGAELITTEYMLVGKDFGLTLSIPKMKVMAVVYLLSNFDEFAGANLGNPPVLFWVTPQYCFG